MTASIRAGSPRIARSSPICSWRSAYSSSTRLRSSPVSAREAEVEDRLRLDLGELETRSCSCDARLVGVGGGADQRDHLVEVVERDQVAGEDVRALLGLAELVLRAADDDLALVVEVVADELEQRQRPRDAVDERDGVVAERRLERRVLEQLVQGDLRDRLALELDLDPHPRAVGVVGEVARSRSGPLSLTRSAIFSITPRVAALLDAVGQLGDDDRALAAAQLLDVGACAHRRCGRGRERYASRMPERPTIDAAGREVGALDVLRSAARRRSRARRSSPRSRRSPRRGCAAGCSSPCRPRSPTSR